MVVEPVQFDEEDDDVQQQNNDLGTARPASCANCSVATFVVDIYFESMLAIREQKNTHTHVYK